MSDFTAPKAGWYTTDPARGWQKISASEFYMRPTEPVPGSSADDMTAWLRAQVESDKTAALAAGECDKAREWDGHRNGYEDSGIVMDGLGNHVVYDEGVPSTKQAIHIGLHDPRDVIADCDAKLRLLALHQPIEGVGGGTECEACGPNNGSPPGLIAVIRDDDGFWPCATVQVLASGYRHRDGWLAEWAA